MQLGHGSGGKLSAALLREHFLPHFSNPAWPAGRCGRGAGRAREIAVSTDTFVVSPLEFPGGNIGSLAVHGTLNDIAMMGARPLYLSAGFVLEEGLPLRGARPHCRHHGRGGARQAGVPLVTGDTKVVERGKADGLFINTTGIGLLDPDFRPGARSRPARRRRAGERPDRPHGMAIMAAREGLGVRDHDRERHGLPRPAGRGAPLRRSVTRCTSCATPPGVAWPAR